MNVYMYVYVCVWGESKWCSGLSFEGSLGRLEYG